MDRQDNNKKNNQQKKGNQAAALSQNQSVALGRSLASFAIGISALLVVSFLFFSLLQGAFFLILFTFPVALTLIPVVFSRLLSSRGRLVSASLLYSVAAPSAFFFGFFLSAALVLLAYGNSLAPSFANLLPALFLGVNSVIIYRFGSTASRTWESNQPIAIMLGRIAGALGLLFVFALAFAAPVFSWLGYPFLYAGIAYGALSVSPLIALSERTKSYREAGLYLMNSSSQWTTVAFLVGFAAGILSLSSANVYTFIGVLVLAAVGVCYIGFKIYSLDSSRLDKMQQQLYQKHVHNLHLIVSEDFDYINRTAGEFITSGKKGNLIVALSTLLTNAGIDYADTKAILERMINYEVPAIFKFPDISLKRSLELEVQRRIGIVNSTMLTMSERLKAR